MPVRHSVKVLYMILPLSLMSLLSACSHQAITHTNASQNSSQKPTTQAHKITVDDIEKFYRQNHRRILDVQPYSLYHAVIVESNLDPTVANDFEWWDTNTGQSYFLAGRPSYMHVEKVLSEDEVVFLASGENSESPGIAFPYYIDCKRPNPQSQFVAANKTAYFAVDKQVSFGDSKVEAVSNMTATADGIAIQFAPIRGNEARFMAGATGAPTTSISYLADKHELVIDFQQTKFNVRSAVLHGIHNSFIETVSTQTRGQDEVVIVRLSDMAKFYTGKVTHTADPTLTLSFVNQIP